MAHEYSVTDSSILVDAPIIALRRDRVVMPGGRQANREVMEHFGAVAVVALDEQGRVAVIEQYRRAVDKRLLELPAGILDIADEDPLDCAKRELVEEAGLVARTWSVLVDLVTSPGFSDEAVRVFLARDLTEVQRPAADDEEADLGFAWLGLDDAVRRVLAGEIVNSIAVGGILAAASVESGAAAARPKAAPFELRPWRLAERRKAQGIGPDLKML
ncbi:NUDIX hydrolase [Corynebacterium mayonis]|uniref:NUDIX hydrolase n=1 Tax=Corynebacterium mayonis TaxID=3062461 RepID=UPI003140B237